MVIAYLVYMKFGRWHRWKEMRASEEGLGLKRLQSTPF
jgi:hypothetical protein